MRIREAARRLGISARSLRHYEAVGLLRTSRLANGYRDLSGADLRQAEWVRDLVAAGFSTRELRRLAAALAGGGQTPVCLKALQGKLGQIDRLIEILQQRRHAVAERLVVQRRAAKGEARS